jgi:methylenetetrahydrofolate dehydrogenase (NADP+)/methenyltetrahydrofolate cyclohydrolase
MTILDGKRVSDEVKAELAQAVQEMVARGERAPHLAAILVGHDGAS